jgi:hypothetical protein
MLPSKSMAPPPDPAYPLAAIKSAVVHQGLIMADDACSSVFRLGLDSSDIVACVTGLHPDEFVHTTCSPWCATLRQDTYRSRYLRRRISVRLHLDSVYGVVVSAFALLSSR